MPPSAFAGPVRVVLGLLGAGSFAAGVLAVFVTENGTGTAVLLAFGGLLLVLAILGNRIESIEFGGAKLRIAAQALERYAAADLAADAGDPVRAAELRAEAQALLDAVGPITSDYAAIRRSRRAGPARTRELEAVLAQARRVAAERDFDRAAVVEFFRRGAREQRVTALAMMEERAELRDPDVMISGIEHSQSGNEQYHALRLALLMLPSLDPVQRARLRRVVQEARGFRFNRDTSRWDLSERLLDQLGADGSS